MAKETFYIIRSEMTTECADGGAYIRTTGCNGRHHAIFDTIEYLGADNKVEHAISIGTKIVGDCNNVGSCYRDNPVLGWFTVEMED